MEELVKLDPNSLKYYFIGIRELSKNGKKFPVDLDTVWVLAYSRKDSAVRELTTKFKEGEDYSKTVEYNDSGFTTVRVHKYYLSAKCLEHFIASKVPEVFEVYRQVFHKTIDSVENKLSLPDFRNPAEAARAWADQYEKRCLAEEEVEKLRPDAEYAKTVLKCDGSYTMSTIAKLLGYKSGEELADKLTFARVLLLGRPYKLSSKYIGKGFPVYVRYGTTPSGNFAKVTMTWTEEGKRFLTSLKADGKI